MKTTMKVGLAMVMTTVLGFSATSAFALTAMAQMDQEMTMVKGAAFGADRSQAAIPVRINLDEEDLVGRQLTPKAKADLDGLDVYDKNNGSLGTLTASHVDDAIPVQLRFYYNGNQLQMDSLNYWFVRRAG